MFDRFDVADSLIALPTWLLARRYPATSRAQRIAESINIFGFRLTPEEFDALRVA